MRKCVTCPYFENLDMVSKLEGYPYGICKDQDSDHFNHILEGGHKCEKEVQDPCPDCGAELRMAPGGGVKCSTPDCGYWFCY